MKLYIDSANTEELALLKNAPFLSGVTTNPKLIAEGIGKNEVTCDEYFDYIQKIRSIISGEIFVQVTSEKKPDIIDEISKIRDNVKGPVVYKIPATAEGFHAISLMAKEGVSVAATAVYTAAQAYLAIASGAKYVIPYFSRIDQHDKQGIETIREIMAISGPEKLLVASIKTEATLYYLLMEGVRNFTLPYQLFKYVAECDLTQDSIKEFSEFLHITWAKKKK